MPAPKAPKVLKNRGLKKNGHCCSLIGKFGQFLINVNFICLTQDYEETNSNNEILANISYNPIALGIADSFWLIANSFLRTKSLNKSKLLNTILGISSCQFGLTGNLELDKNGARKYFKYCIRKGYIYNEKFVWERVGTCDNKVGLTLTKSQKKQAEENFRYYNQVELDESTTGPDTANPIDESDAYTFLDMIKRNKDK